MNMSAAILSANASQYAGRTRSTPSSSQDLRTLRARLVQTAERPVHSATACGPYLSSCEPPPRKREHRLVSQAADVQEAVLVEDEPDSAAFGLDDDATLPTDILTDNECLYRLDGTVHDNAKQYYHAFYSSELAGITTQPAFMMVHIDDHMVHRGHAVFDTALVVNGHIYMLDDHLERLKYSANYAGLELPSSMPQLKRIVMETVAASKKMNGRGDFAISPKECLYSSFYCVMTTLKEGDPLHNPGSDYLRGRKVKSSPVPPKDPYFSIFKSTNYLPNVLTVMDAEKDNLDYGIFMDPEGYVAEGPTMNVMILTKAGELLIPPFEYALPGLTLLRIMQLIPEHWEDLQKDVNYIIKKVVQRKFNKYEVYDCKEAMLVGSTTYITSIVQWDGKDIGDGAMGDEPGILSLVLRRMLKNDMDPNMGNSENFTEVPYGYLTSMEGAYQLVDGRIPYTPKFNPDVPDYGMLHDDNIERKNEPFEGENPDHEQEAEVTDVRPQGEGYHIVQESQLGTALEGQDPQ